MGLTESGLTLPLRRSYMLTLGKQFSFRYKERDKEQCIYLVGKKAHTVCTIEINVKDFYFGE